jgi:hypothetical protein
VDNQFKAQAIRFNFEGAPPRCTCRNHNPTKALTEAAGSVLSPLGPPCSSGWWAPISPELLDTRLS